MPYRTRDKSAPPDSGDYTQDDPHFGYVPLQAHLDSVQVWREKFYEERDRRYTEVGIEREKALKIKETADLAALQLARDIQIYKDEKANELRSQIERERGSYVTKAELKPIGDWVVAQAGKSQGSSSALSWVIASVGALVGVVSLVLYATK